jgi:endonuclease YncB( thermonuclease family)
MAYSQKSFGPYPMLVLDWYDGDTCHVRLDLGFGIFLQAVSCRIYGINAPELTNRPAGQDAKAYAQQLCPDGTLVKVLSHGWDKYGGRFDGEITLEDGRDFGHAMIEAGQAVVMA